MSYDIVARLRVWSTWLDERCPDTEVRNDIRDAADEIERLRSVVEAWKTYSSRAERDIAQLREERDGARAEVCLLRTSSTTASDVVDQSMADYAESRGWKDLFRENTDDR